MKLEFRFNGQPKVLLFPETDEDWKLIDLAFAKAKSIEVRMPVRDSENKESLTLVVVREESAAVR